MPTVKADGGGEVEFFYPGFPGDPPAPRGQKLILLNSGGACINGTWTDDGAVVGWTHLPRRNKEKEAWLKCKRSKAA